MTKGFHSPTSRVPVKMRRSSTQLRGETLVFKTLRNEFIVQECVCPPPSPVRSLLGAKQHVGGGLNST